MAIQFGVEDHSRKYFEALEAMVSLLLAVFRGSQVVIDLCCLVMSSNYKSC